MKKRKFGNTTTLIIGSLLCLCLLIPGCGGGGKKESVIPEKKEAKKEEFPPQKLTLVSNLIQGRKIFEAKNCSQCHAIFKKVEKAGPTLDTSQFYGTFLDIFSILWNHAPAMAVHMRKEGLPRPQFSTPELNQLVSFLYMLPYLGKPGNPVKGENLLRKNLCFTCHSLGDKGKLGGVPLDTLTAYESLVVLIQRMWNHGPVMLSQMIATGTPVPSFSGNDMMDLFAALTRDQGTDKMRKISLGVGDVANGKLLFKEKECEKCHAIFGEGGNVAMDLGKSVSQSSVTELAALLWNHAADMQEKFRERKISWPYFSETEMSDLIVFLYSFSYDDKPGDPGRGKKVFENKNCADCHFETEGDKEKFLRGVRMGNSAQFAAYLWNHLPTMEETMVSQAVSWPDLSGKELRDILAYFRSQ